LDQVFFFVEMADKSQNNNIQTVNTLIEVEYRQH